MYSLPWSEMIWTSVVLFASLGLMEMKRLATWPAVEHPIDRISAEDGCDFLLRGKHDEGRLQQAGADDRRRLRLLDDDGSGRIRLEVWLLGVGGGGESVGGCGDAANTEMADKSRDDFTAGPFRNMVMARFMLSPLGQTARCPREVRTSRPAWIAEPCPWAWSKTLRSCGCRDSTRRPS